MKALTDLIDAAERLQQLAAEARAQCVAAHVRLEELQHRDHADRAALLAGLVRLRAELGRGRQELAALTALPSARKEGP